ncbi:hypothetical protein [Streptomyces sp. NRRL S-1448]|uniref:hypothetical protein n=1 Tax=Streptomyces sp. NRRL S-1448 TaxID=1463883 RepID=UPI0005600CCA|nr:hypothetical protein [Streptomyces sp. NRRL S-1448]
MSHATTRFLLLLLRLLIPARGRHRTDGALPEARCVDAPTLAPHRSPVRQPGLLRGEDSALVRPYLLTPAELQQRRSQHQRRQVLWLAPRGIDVRPLESHAVGATA